MAPTRRILPVLMLTVGCRQVEFGAESGQRRL